MDERSFINQSDIKSDKSYQKMPMRSSFPQEIFETEQKFGLKGSGYNLSEERVSF